VGPWALEPDGSWMVAAAATPVHVVAAPAVTALALGVYHLVLCHCMGQVRSVSASQERLRQHKPEQ